MSGDRKFISVGRTAYERWRPVVGALGVTISQLVEHLALKLPDPPPRLTKAQRRAERWRNISISRSAFNRYLPLAAARGISVSKAAEQALAPLLFPGGPNMSMPNLTAFPPTEAETRALEPIANLLGNSSWGAVEGPDEDALREHVLAAVLDPALAGFWQRVKESAAWHDMNDAAQAADLTPRKLSGV